MEAVFLGGSRRIVRLNDEIRSVLDRLIDRGVSFLVGDANGADRALQQHLAERGYERVVVYAVAGSVRNNVGRWEVRFVEPPEGSRGFEFYSAKDLRMASDASYGLMLWDGRSRGTLENVRNLVGQRKPVVVHLGPKRSMVSLRSSEDLHKLSLSPTPKSNSQHVLPFSSTPGAAPQGHGTDGARSSPSGRCQPKKRRSGGVRGRN
jgi:hypothetical protein